MRVSPTSSLPPAASPAELRTVAVLFADARGAYSKAPGVELWDIKRDARTYAGPHPVIAHPPCAVWCRLAGLVEARYPEHRRGEDGGCFAAALSAVRTWGGVLEHPAYSDAWLAFDLPSPPWVGWQRGLCGGWSCHVEQGRHGHVARKATWLYACGVRPQALVSFDWGREPNHGSGALCSWCGNHAKRDYTPVGGGEARAGRVFRRQRVGKKAAAATPAAFRDALLAMARAVDLTELLNT